MGSARGGRDVSRLSGHSCFQPPADEPDHLCVVDVLSHFAQQTRMGEVVEERDDVELSHPAITASDRLPDPPHRLLGALSRPVAEATGKELGLEDRLYDLAGGLLDHPVRDSGYAQRTCPSVGLRDLDPPNCRRGVALRRQQPTAKAFELSLLVLVEGCDRLVVDSCCTRIRLYFHPGSCEVRRIGDGFQQLAHADQTSFTQPLSSHPCNRQGRHRRLPAQRSVVVPVSPLACRSLRGLVSVGPFARHRAPLGFRAARSRLATGQRALPRLQLLRTV